MASPRGIDGTIYLRKREQERRGEREIIHFYPQLCVKSGYQLVLQLTSPLTTVTPSSGHMWQTINQPIKEKLGKARWPTSSSSVLIVPRMIGHNLLDSVIISL